MKWWWWAAVNVLNVADVFLTKYILSIGGGEGNPFVRYIGWTWKFILVLVASSLLLWLYPNGLLIVGAVLLAVVVYSAAGILWRSGR